VAVVTVARLVRPELQILAVVVVVALEMVLLAAQVS
jgi:hypothetical protein